MHVHDNLGSTCYLVLVWCSLLQHDLGAQHMHAHRALQPAFFLSPQSLLMLTSCVSDVHCTPRDCSMSLCSLAACILCGCPMHSLPSSHDVWQDRRHAIARAQTYKPFLTSFRYCVVKLWEWSTIARVACVAHHASLGIDESNALPCLSRLASEVGGLVDAKECNVVNIPRGNAQNGSGQGATDQDYLVRVTGSSSRRVHDQHV